MGRKERLERREARRAEIEANREARRIVRETAEKIQLDNPTMDRDHVLAETYQQLQVEWGNIPAFLDRLLAAYRAIRPLLALFGVTAPELLQVEEEEVKTVSTSN